MIENFDHLAPGDRVRITRGIYDDGQDHHPPGFIAVEGDIVTIIDKNNGGLLVNHSPHAKHGFYVYGSEVE